MMPMIVGPHSAIKHVQGMKPSGGALYEVLFHEAFDVDEVAPIANRDALPGPGEFTTNDAGAAISSSRLNWSLSNKYAGGNTSEAVAGGLACYSTLTQTAGRAGLFYSKSFAGELGVWRKSNGDIRQWSDGEVLQANSTHMVTGGGWTILRGPDGANGKFFITSNGLLRYISSEGMSKTVAFPGNANYTPINAGVGENKLVLLKGAWTGKYPCALESFDGAVSAGQTFTHTEGFLINFHVTAKPSAGNIRVAFRKQDDDNYMYIQYTSAGNVNVGEVVATVDTTLTGIAVGANPKGICLYVHTNDTMKHWFRDAYYATVTTTRFNTETAGEVISLGTGGAIKDLGIFPLVLTDGDPDAAAILDEVEAL